jgi:hypothetical protein
MTEATRAASLTASEDLGVVGLTRARRRCEHLSGDVVTSAAAAIGHAGEPDRGVLT